MRITVEVPAILEGQPRPSEGVVLAEGLALYLDPDLLDVGVIGGTVRLRCLSPPTVSVEYFAPRRLSDEELLGLVKFTAGQISDGAGEGGFSLRIEDDELIVWAADEASAASVLQFEDATPVPSPSRAAIGAREGRLEEVKAAVSSGDSVDAALGGYTPLQLALLYGHPEIALYLLAKGADPNCCDPIGNTSLHLCAISGALSDVDACRVARELISHGADQATTGSSGNSAKELAELRGKPLLARFLSFSA